MSTETFTDFLALLDREGELARVAAPVTPILEISEIADRMSKSPAPHGHQEPDRRSLR
jgi:UbiD family decarboxylase